ncbi:uncharacterized protein DS421_13g408110 [Arachis hypogaea]|nr:uncharacterized protein DS421_13g408110 [Arachis hypogaea]
MINNIMGSDTPHFFEQEKKIASVHHRKLQDSQKNISETIEIRNSKVDLPLSFRIQFAQK